mmetsp:Transcript_21720/g.56400  ORF Transcript_21720/g.56400 Transcript_21720/m.56400 type:complete len:242 (-) Transcript_21720:84-809(-)
MDHFLGSMSQPIDWKSLLNFSELNSRVKSHLTKVYATLAVALLSAAVGSYCQIAFHLPAMLFQFGFVLSTIAFAMMNRAPENMSTRANALMGVAFLKGGAIAPLIESVAFIDPSIVTTAFLGTSVIFIAFTLTSLKAERRSYLFLGGILLNAMLLLGVVGFASFFFHIPAVFAVQLYGGFLVFCGYVLYDTQLLVEKANAGSYDYPQHALELFVDFVAIFVRLLIILAKNSENDKKKKERR